MADVRRAAIRTPIEMIRPDTPDPDDAPSVYARLAAQTDIVERALPVPEWIRWFGRVVAVAIVVVALVGVIWGHAG